MSTIRIRPGEQTTVGGRERPADWCSSQHPTSKKVKMMMLVLLLEVAAEIQPAAATLAAVSPAATAATSTATTTLKRLESLRSAKAEIAGDWSPASMRTYAASSNQLASVMAGKASVRMADSSSGSSSSSRQARSRATNRVILPSSSQHQRGSKTRANREFGGLSGGGGGDIGNSGDVDEMSCDEFRGKHKEVVETFVGRMMKPPADLLKLMITEIVRADKMLTGGRCSPAPGGLRIDNISINCQPVNMFSIAIGKAVNEATKLVPSADQLGIGWLGEVFAPKDGADEKQDEKQDELSRLVRWTRTRAVKLMEKLAKGDVVGAIKCKIREALGGLVELLDGFSSLNERGGGDASDAEHMRQLDNLPEIYCDLTSEEAQVVDAEVDANLDVDFDTYEPNDSAAA